MFNFLSGLVFGGTTAYMVLTNEGRAITNRLYKLIKEDLSKAQSVEVGETPAIATEQTNIEQGRGEQNVCNT